MKILELRRKYSIEIKRNPALLLDIYKDKGKEEICSYKLLKSYNLRTYGACEIYRKREKTNDLWSC